MTYENAVNECLRDVDSLTDWLCSECMGGEACQWPHIREASAEDFQRATVRNLIGLLFDVGHPAIVTQAARDALLNRYLARPETQARIDRIVDRAEAEERHAAMFDRLMGRSNYVEE